MQHDNLVAHALYVIRRCPRADTVAHGLSGSAIVCWPSLWRVGVYQGAAREGMRREAWERTEEGLIFNGADAEQERRHGQGVQNGIAADVAGLHQLFLLALSYGVLMGTRGFSFLWPMCMSAFIFTGSMEFVTVNLLVSAFNPFVTFMLAVMLGTRHLFYGISMLGRFKNMGAKKPYLIFSLCDETFAIDNGTIIAADVDRGWFYFFVGLLNQSSWVAGATLGGLLGERITFNTSGLDFIMTAMFAVIFVDQWLTTKRKATWPRLPA